VGGPDLDADEAAILLGRRRFTSPAIADGRRWREDGGHAISGQRLAVHFGRIGFLARELADQTAATLASLEV